MIPKPHAPRRSGIALALGLLVLSLIVLVFGALLERARHSRNLHLSETRSLQAAWLSESGLERAFSKLVEDPDYSGETWVIPSRDLGGPDSARVRILVEPIDAHPSLRRVKVRADYPDNRWTRVRRARTGILELDPANHSEKD